MEKKRFKDSREKRSWEQSSFGDSIDKKIGNQIQRNRINLSSGEIPNHQNILLSFQAPDSVPSRQCLPQSGRKQIENVGTAPQSIKEKEAREVPTSRRRSRIDSAKFPNGREEAEVEWPEIEMQKSFRGRERSQQF